MHSTSSRQWICLIIVHYCDALCKVNNNNNNTPTIFIALSSIHRSRATARVHSVNAMNTERCLGNDGVCMCLNQVNAVRALAQILRRYTSLNHLAQAARAVLQNSNQITQMLADINKVDFTSVQVRLPLLSLICIFYLNLLSYFVDFTPSIYNRKLP